jgi:hypothetical protein
MVRMLRGASLSSSAARVCGVGNVTVKMLESNVYGVRE